MKRIHTSKPQPSHATDHNQFFWISLTPCSFPINSCVASSLVRVGKNQIGCVRISRSSDVIIKTFWLQLLPRFTGTPPWLCRRLTPGGIFPGEFSSRFLELGRCRLRGLLGRCPEDPGLDNPEFWFWFWKFSIANNKYFFMLVLLRRTSFWPPSMVYISIIFFYKKIIPIYKNIHWKNSKKVGQQMCLAKIIRFWSKSYERKVLCQPWNLSQI